MRKTQLPTTIADRLQLSPWLEGFLNGCHLSVESFSPEASDSHLTVRPRGGVIPRGFAAQRRPGPALRPIGGAGRGNVASGDPALDQQVEVWGHAVTVHAALTAEARALLLRVTARGGLVARGGVSRLRAGFPADPDQLEAELIDCTALASALRVEDPEDDPMERLLRIARTDPVLTVRVNCFEAALESASAETLDPILEVGRAIRHSRARLLVALQSPEAELKTLLALLADPDDAIASRAARAVGRIGDRDTLPALALLEGRGGEVARSASAARAAVVARLGEGSGHLSLVDGSDPAGQLSLLEGADSA